MTSSWPSGAVVKVLACHAGGREFESPLEQFSNICENQLYMHIEVQTFDKILDC